MEDKARLTTINELLDHCRKAPFYRDRFPAGPIRSLAEFKTLPLLTKGDLRALSPNGLICVEPEELLQYHETFGTTGTPVSIWLTEEDIRWHAREVNRSAVAFTPRDRVLVRFPYAISLIAHMVHRAAQEQGACVIAASSRSTVSPFPRVVNLMGKLEVSLLAGLPLQALLLAETARLLGLDPRKDFPRLRGIITGGEPLPPHRRRLIEETWGVPVYELYGMTEIGTPVTSCRFGRNHVWVDQFHVEILRDDLVEEAGPGETGWLVVTPLNKRGTPLVRYFTEDRARWMVDLCPCGQPGSIQVLGRKQFTLEAGGRTFDMNELDEILAHLPCRRFWVAGPQDGGIRLVVEEESPGCTVDRETMDGLAKKTGVPIQVEVVPQGTLYDRQELLAVAEVGKPRYIYTAEEMAAKAYLLSAKT